MKNAHRTLPLLVLLGGATAVSGQEPLGADQLLQVPGQTVASYKDPASPAVVRGARSARGPVAGGGVEVVGYSIERIDLGQPRNVQGVGATRSMVTNEAWRVRVYTSNLRVRSTPVTVWIGDKMVGRGVESPDLSSVVAVTTDPSLIASGLPVSISYQDQPDPSLVAKSPIQLDTKR